MRVCAATETGACDEACVIISTKGFMDSPGREADKKSREEGYRESGESVMFFPAFLLNVVWKVRLNDEYTCGVCFMM